MEPSSTAVTSVRRLLLVFLMFSEAWSWLVASWATGVAILAVTL